MNGWYGGYYGQEDASSPLAYVRADAPPFFIAHGDHDTVAPAEVARYFAGKMRNVSTNPVVYAGQAQVPGGQQVRHRRLDQRRRPERAAKAGHGR